MQETYFIPSCELEYKRLTVLHDVYLKPTALALKSCFAQVGANPVIFDVGCGIGLMTRWIGEHLKGAVIGMDLSASQLQEAKKRTDQSLKHISYSQYDLGQAEPFSEQADITYCRYVLHHLTHPSLGIQNLIKMTKPQGQILFIEPIMYGYWAYPEVPEIVELQNLLTKMNQNHHWDPNYGQKLLYDLKNFDNIEIQSVDCYQPIMTRPQDKLHFHLAARIFRNDLIQSGVANAKTMDRIELVTKQAAEDPQCTISLFGANMVRAIRKS